MKKFLIFGAVFLLLCYWCSDGDSSSSSSSQSSYATQSNSLASVEAYWMSNGKKTVIQFETDDYGIIYIEGREELKSKFKVYWMRDVIELDVNSSVLPIYIGNKVYSKQLYIADGHVYPSLQSAQTRDTSYPHSQLTRIK